LAQTRDAKLKAKIRDLYKAQLQPLGFNLKSARLPKRMLPGLRQGIEFQPGGGHLAGKYTLNIYWGFRHRLDEGYAFDGCVRPSDLIGSDQDVWYSREDEFLDIDFAAVEELVESLAIPYLVRHESVEKIVREFDAGRLSRVHGFGVDVGWQEFNLGFCRAFVGDSAGAVRHYWSVVVNHSHEPLDFIQRRKRAALDEIERLGRN